MTLGSRLFGVRGTSKEMVKWLVYEPGERGKRLIHVLAGQWVTTGQVREMI